MPYNKFKGASARQRQTRKDFKRRPTVNYERFPSEYFSGSNIRIFFDDIFVDECTGLQFELQEEVRPIHGYNSYTMDHLMRGKRLVQGSFSMNFRDRYYLYSLLDELTQDRDNFEYEDNFPLRDYANQFPSREEYKDDIEKYRNILHEYAERGWDTKFNELSNILEDKLWEKGSADNREDKISEAKYKPLFPDQDTTFDIVIEYGNYHKEHLTAREKRYAEAVNPGTIEVLKNVQLTGCQKVIDTSGKPIQEMYRFLAEDYL